MSPKKRAAQSCFGHLSRWISCFSGKWVLEYLPNGRDAIFIRSVVVAAVVFVIFLAVLNGLDSSRSWTPSCSELKRQLLDHQVKFGVIFVAAYSALYARFSAQWEYLANLFNQIKAAECRRDCEGAQIVEWKAAFIEDAQDLYLAEMPIFASVIHAWCQEPDVRESYVRSTAGGERRLNSVMASAREIFDTENRRW